MGLLSIILPKPSCSQAGEPPAADDGGTGKDLPACGPAIVTEELDVAIAAKLAEKIVGGWLAERRAMMFPLVLDLANLDDDQREAIVHVVISAATSHGPWSNDCMHRADKVLEPALPDQDERTAAIARALATPRALHQVLDGRDMRMASLFYSLSLLAADRRSAAGRHYLRFVAARLRLPEDVAWQLERRYRL